MTPRPKDDLFSRRGAPGKFEFNDSVARVFDNMIERSVPFYRECLAMTVDLALRFARPGTAVYDLGCSTGTILKRLGQALPEDFPVQLIGVDNSAPMLKKARRRLKDCAVDWRLEEADLNTDFELVPASVVILNYTLQFVPPARRGRLLRRIQNALVPGGCLLLIEKVTAETKALDLLYVDQHHRFKRERGYSRLEISRKRDALEKVLVPRKPRENVKMLQNAGFKDIDMFFKWFNFAGFLALKPGRGRSRRK